jgi:flagellar assembly factor FliW
MKIDTSRFGTLDVGEDVIIRMTKPVLGFEQYRKYVIVETDDFEPFKWFQSVENAELAFVIVNPSLFFPDYTIEVNPKEIEELEVDEVGEIITYSIVTIPSDYTRMTANLQGPILINSRTRLAKQLVLVNSQHGIKHRLFSPVETEAPGKKTPERIPVRA